MKSGGRQKGTPNKITSELKEVIKGIIERNFQGVEEAIQEMPAPQRIEILIKLLPYCLPKASAHQEQFIDLEQITGHYLRRFPEDWDESTQSN